MPADFDHIASKYDADFTKSEIGRIQRRQVHNYLDKVLIPPLRILEINCGTGEDAAYLSNRGYDVMATDISSAMIAIARENHGHNVKFEVLDINEISTLNGQQFDLVFSNFGGLNCLSPQELKSLGERLNKLISPGGEFIAVVMGRNCFWERSYFWLKRDRVNKQRRRNTGAVNANVEGVIVPTWYFNPHEFASLFSSYINIKSIIPIGLFVPPSYLEPFFKNKKNILRILSVLDRFKWKTMADYADHYLIHFQKKD